MDRLIYLLRKFDSKTATLYEQSELLFLLSASNKDLDVFFPKINENLSLDKIDELPNEKSKEILAYLKKQISLKTDEKVSGYPKENFRKIIKNLSIAATFLIMIAISFLVFLQKVNSVKQHRYDLTANVSPIDSFVIWTNNSPNIEQRKLADGTVVLLKGGSTLKYKRNFDQYKRELYLNGKAKFIVEKDAARPFTVFSGNISTTALGTIFTVNYDSLHEHIGVELFRGKIVVKNIKHSNQIFYLLPGDKCNYDGQDILKREFKERKKTVTSANNPDRNNSCLIQGDVITFNQSDLEEVFEQFGKFYGKKIILNTKRNSIKYSGIFNKDKITFETALKAICNISNLVWTRTANGIYLIQPE